MPPLAVDTRKSSSNTSNTLRSSRGRGSGSMGRLKALNIIIDNRDSSSRIQQQRTRIRLTRRGAEICTGSSSNIREATASSTLTTTPLVVGGLSKPEGALETLRPTRTTPNTTTATTASSSSEDSRVALGRSGTKRIYT